MSKSKTEILKERLKKLRLEKVKFEERHYQRAYTDIKNLIDVLLNELERSYMGLSRKFSETEIDHMIFYIHSLPENPMRNKLIEKLLDIKSKYKSK